MFSAEDMADDQLTLLTTGDFINVHGASKLMSQIIHSMIPLQSLGYIGVDGAEVHVGDVIGGILRRDSIATMGRIDFSDVGSCFVNVNDAGETRLFEIDQIKVLGNIYENPELMGDQS